MERRRFLKVITSAVLLSGCLSSPSGRIKVEKKNIDIKNRRCTGEVHETANVTFDRSKAAISISGTASLNSVDENITVSVFTTKGGDGASGKDSVIIKFSSRGGRDTNSSEDDCVPMLEYEAEIAFNRMPIDVLVDYEIRENGNSGFVTHATYNDSESDR